IKCKPAANPTNALASRREIKACSCSLITNTSNKKMERPVMINRYIVLSIVLPFCYDTILMSPKGIFPVMAYFRHFPDMILVDFQSQAGAFRDLNIALILFKYSFIHDVIEQVTALVLVYAQALFLN